MAETTEKTLAGELREAAARARGTFVPAAVARVSYGTRVAICGNHAGSPILVCQGCVYFDTEDPVLARLLVALLNAREPLASWLEKEAKDFDEQMVEDELECSNCDTSWPCGGHPQVLIHDDGCGGCIDTGSSEDCRCFDHARAVARVLNGATS